MTNEIWGKWNLNTPPVEGAVATERGWEIPLKGTAPADGLTEVIVAIGGLAVRAAGSNIQSVTILTAAGYLLETDNFDIEVVFNENVDVTGTPRIELTLDTGTVYADYFSGTGTNALTFRYTVEADVEAQSGPIIVSPIDLNGGTMEDDDGEDSAILTFSPPSAVTRIIDSIVPAITSVVATEDGNDLDTGAVIHIVVTLDEAVIVTGVPKIPMFEDDGTTPLAGNSGMANYISGSGTTVLNFRYTVVVGDSEAVGIAAGDNISLNGGTIKDAAGNAADLTFTQEPFAITLNVAPSILTVEATEDGTDLDTGAFVHIIVTMDEAAVVTGTPRIPMFEDDGTTPLAGNSGFANYLSGSGTDTLTFRYTVVSGDAEAVGIAAGDDIALNGGTIKDAAGNNAVLTFTQEPFAITLNVAPTILTAVATEDGTDLDTGAVIHFVVTYDEAVVVAGTPQIPVFENDGTTPLNGNSGMADYLSGTGTTALTFAYTIDVLDDEATGMAFGADIDLNGGTLEDAAGNAADVTFTQVATTITLNVAPTILTVVTPEDGTNVDTAGIVNINVTYDEAVVVTGVPQIPVFANDGTTPLAGNSGMADYVGGTGTTVINFQYTVNVGDNEAAGIKIGADIDLNGGTMEDAAANAADLTFGQVATTLTLNQ